jgi:hypothetical protein
LLQKTIQKPNKHDRYVLELYKKVSDRYDYLILDYIISNNKRKLGQVDLAGVRGARTDLFEVKCSFRIHKAVKQLKRAQKIMNVTGNLFFYCGSSGQIQEVLCETR